MSIENASGRNKIFGRSEARSSSTRSIGGQALEHQVERWADISLCLVGRGLPAAGPILARPDPILARPDPTLNPTAN